MKLPLALLIASLSLPAAQEKILAAKRRSHTVVLSHVYLNGKGPYRMMIDTGATSSSVRPDIAAQLGSEARYLVERVTASGSERLAAVQVEVRVDDVVEQNVEVLVGNVAISGVDGVLGQSWLRRHSYLLDYRELRLILDPDPPTTGLSMDLRWSEGRPSISAQVDGVPQDLVIDSGTPALVLFRSAKSTSLSKVITNQGTASASMGTATVQIGTSYRRHLAAAELNQPYSAGLLPTAAFRSVYVSPRIGLVVLVPR